MTEPAATAAPRGHVAAFWCDAAAFMAAAGAARDARLPGLVAYAPWPVHGLESTMGHPRSWIGRAVLAAVLLGAAACLAFFVQSSVTEYPINVSGKPYFSPQFWVVPILETALLAGALVNLLACFHACRLVPGPAAIPDPRVTDDQFCLVVPIDGDRYSAASLTRWFEDHHAERIAASATDAEAAHA
jgi:hypothetical protein